MGQLAGRWKWIPNVGAWITTRDPSDYSNVNGLMIEDFAKWDGDGYFAPGDLDAADEPGAAPHRRR